MQKTTFHNNPSSQSRILLLSMRELEFHVSRSYINEFENCISSWDTVDLLSIPYFSKTLPVKIVNNLSRKYFQISGNPKTYNPISNYFSLNSKYDLFFFICQKPIDLLYLNSITNWRDRCSKAVCLLDEVWLENYNKEQKQLSVLKNFDYVFMNLSSSIKAVADTIQKPCYYLAPGIDAVEFCPYPLQPQRSIDVCSFGRRSPSIHQSLVSLGKQSNFFYIYDTMSHLFTNNYQDHRALYQNLIKRSNYFIAYKPYFNLQQKTGTQEEVNIRFFEGAAGGAVILGTPPQSDTFKQNFDWTDAVIEVSDSTPNVAETIAELNTQPERLKEIRKNNVVNSLLRHDWVYRWSQILDKVGLSPTPKMAQRRAQLQQLADIAIQKSS